MTVPEMEMKVLDLRDESIQRQFLNDLKEAGSLVWIDNRYMSWNLLEKATKPAGWE